MRPRYGAIGDWRWTIGDRQGWARRDPYRVNLLGFPGANASVPFPPPGTRQDNMKYLGTLERFMEPLFSGKPQAILECLPALINALKMIHTISRYFNTTQKTTRLFMKVTNQMIATCKLAINNNG
jgi:hypothetical protein